MKWRLLCGMAVMVAGCVAAASLWAGDSEAKKPNLGKLRHVVLLKFKNGATSQQIKAVENAFRALPAKVPEIVDFEWGTNNSPENRTEGFTHCFFVTFSDAAGRAVYLPHPAHKAFGKVLRPVLDKVLVIDYVAKE
jgi:hypothetical protein